MYFIRNNSFKIYIQVTQKLFNKSPSAADLYPGNSETAQKVHQPRILYRNNNMEKRRDHWTLLLEVFRGETLTLSNMKASSRGHELYL